MFRFVRTGIIFLAVLAASGPILAIDPDRDFSGKWIYDSSASNTRAISAPEDQRLSITSDDSAAQCTSTRADGSSVKWSYALDGKDTRYVIGQDKFSSKTKWEGSALLINTIVSGSKSYSILDRWSLSRDRGVLTIERQTMQGGRESEGVLRFRREGQAAPTFTESIAPKPSAREAIASSNNPPPALVRPPAPPTPSELVVKAGTRIPLSLRNAINTKHSHEGDGVYLDTLYPVVVDNKIVIPRGSYVIGTLTIAKPAGTVKGKGELFIRFDSVTLPNGTTRDFRSRLASADTAHGRVDRKEGTITGERDKAGQAKTTAEGAGIGAGIGGIAGAAAGHPLGG